MERSATVRDLARRLEDLEAGRNASGASGSGAPGVRGSDAPARPGAVPTGLAPLDRLLPRGGLPRGRATEWWGPFSSGKTALLRTVAARRLAAGHAVAVVDARRTLFAPDWAGLEGGGGEEQAGERDGRGGRLWMVRPPSPEEAGLCADLLLRSRAFGLVILLQGEAGAPNARGPEATLGRGEAVRLQRLAEEADAVLVAAGRLPVAALRLRFRPAPLTPEAAPPFGPVLPPVRRVRVRVGGRGEVELSLRCPSPEDHPHLRPRTASVSAPDRKGRR